MNDWKLQHTDAAALGRWARVALAARCARRVLPLLRHCWPGATEAHEDILDCAITMAEDSAAQGVALTCPHLTPHNARAGEVAEEADAFGGAAHAAHCASAAASAIYVSHGHADPETLRAAMHADYATAAAHGDGPMSPGDFGPMWPNGTPAGWPSEQE